MRRLADIDNLGAFGNGKMSSAHKEFYEGYG